MVPWLLLALGVIALAIFLFRKKDNGDLRADTDKTTYSSSTTNAAAADADWNSVDWNAPAARYDEISGNDVDVRGTDSYAIYGLGENVLFDKDAATIRPQAEANLKQIVASIGKRWSGGPVRIYGFTDATGSAQHNQQLSQQRAEAVKSWLVQNGSLPGDRVSIQAQGENNPVATNATEEGKQQNRRVQIVARKG